VGINIYLQQVGIIFTFITAIKIIFCQFSGRKRAIIIRFFLHFITILFKSDVVTIFVIIINAFLKLAITITWNFPQFVIITYYFFTPAIFNVNIQWVATVKIFIAAMIVIIMAARSFIALIIIMEIIIIAIIHVLIELAAVIRIKLIKYFFIKSIMTMSIIIYLLGV